MIPMPTNSTAPGGDLKGRFRDLITRVTGIQMPATKQNMIDGRMRRRYSTLGYSDLDSYLKLLFEEDRIQQELPHIVDLMSTNKTDFFREPAHFHLLRNTILPAHNTEKPFKFWSAASSSGQEAYTTAMLLAEYQRVAPAFRYGILGTDISPNILEEARAGVYPQDVLRDVPEGFRERYFVPGQDSRGNPCGRVVENLRKKVRFEQLNLIHGNFPLDRDIDVAFLRNVLIYFDDATQSKVVSSVADHVKVGGYFFVGHSESMIVRDKRLKQIAAAVFRKEKG